MKRVLIIIAIILCLPLFGCSEENNPPTEEQTNKVCAGGIHYGLKGSSWKYNENCHYLTCTTCGEDVGFEEHVFSNWVTEKYQSCEEEGLNYRECFACHYRQEEIIPKHNPSNDYYIISETGQHSDHCTACSQRLDVHEPDYGEVFNEIKATCTEPGYYSQKCNTCEKTFTFYVEPLEHNYGDLIVDVDSTFTTRGYGHRICERCGDVLENVIVFEKYAHYEITNDDERNLRIYLLNGSDEKYTNVDYQDYHFGEEGYLIADKELVHIRDKVYYLENNIVKLQGLIIGEVDGEKRLMYADWNGCLRTNTEWDVSAVSFGFNAHFKFDENGIASEINYEDDYTYVYVASSKKAIYMIGSTVYEGMTLRIQVVGVDGNNRVPLGGATVTVQTSNYDEVQVTSGIDNAIVCFENVPFNSVVNISASCEGYTVEGIQITTEVNRFFTITETITLTVLP